MVPARPSMTSAAEVSPPQRREVELSAHLADAVEVAAVEAQRHAGAAEVVGVEAYAPCRHAVERGRARHEGTQPCEVERLELRLDAPRRERDGDRPVPVALDAKAPRREPSARRPAQDRDVARDTRAHAAERERRAHQARTNAARVREVELDVGAHRGRAALARRGGTERREQAVTLRADARAQAPTGITHRAHGHIGRTERAGHHEAPRGQGHIDRGLISLEARRRVERRGVGAQSRPRGDAAWRRAPRR